LQGAVTYTADGHFHFIAVPTNLPKYASNDATKPSPEEAMAVASGVVAYTGTYTVDEATKTIIPAVVTATYANLVGTDQQRVVTKISDSEMEFTNPKASGGRVLYIAWKKAPPVK
jgi:lipocalin-like protein